LTHQHFLVTGGAGFIGSHLAERLLRDNLGQVTTFDNLHRGTLAHLAEYQHRIRFIHADIRDAIALRTAMVDVDVVFHLAAQSNVLGAEKDPDYAASTNVLGTINVLRAARDAGVRRVVFASSREVYGDPDALPVPETALVQPKNAYGASKAAGEAYCSAIRPSLEVVVLRLANVYGPRDSDRVIPIFLRNAQRGEPLVVHGGSQVLDFVWIGDVVLSLIRAATMACVREPINVGSGAGTSILDLVQIISDITASNSDVQILPARNLETCRFVADTRRMQTYLGVAPGDSLVHHLKHWLSCCVTGARQPQPTPAITGNP
jgi:UDP-glucose 4-epimerase